MAKKTAPKKKVATVKSSTSKSKALKSVKPAKSVAKTKVKPLKPAPAAKKTTVKVANKPLAKTAGKVSSAPKITASVKKAVVPDAETEVKKKLNVVSMMESGPAAEELQKVEKISKVKPVKVDRGNLADEKAKWIELNKKYGKEKAMNYKMTEVYPNLVPLQHKVLGWGFILTNDNDRLEVLFENGIRMLISNYKPV